ncbi:hypothetical protein COOONC_06000 [Cooperia oncophora]
MDRDGSFLLRLGQQNVFDVDATAAGPGKLRAEVRNSESALLGEGPAVDDLGYGKYRVAFTPNNPDDTLSTSTGMSFPLKVLSRYEHDQLTNELQLLEKQLHPSPAAVM